MNDMEECCERIDRKKWMKRPIKKTMGVPTQTFCPAYVVEMQYVNSNEI